MTDPTLHAQLAHDIKFVLEAFLGAAFLTFCWFMAPHITKK